MKKILVAGIAAAALCGAPALAADIPTKGPVYKAALAPVDPWTGFYAGGSIGARWSDVDWRTVDFSTGGAASSVDNPAHLGNTSFRVGGYVGYNWKVAPAWLAGVEGDIAWAENKKTHTPFPGVSIFGPPFGTGLNFVTAKLDWDASLRARLGVLVQPNWLLYVTGGAAWQAIKTISTCGPAGGGYCALGVTVGDSNSTLKGGWTVGGGAETALPGNWLARVEYRYADFGHVTNTLPPAPGAGFNARVAVKTNIALFGLAYKY